MDCQKILVLYLRDSALDSDVIAWSIWDGSSLDENYSGKTDDPPYNSGLDALRDGWWLIQMSPLLPPIPGKELQTSILKYEFIFEKLAKKNENQIIKNGRDG